SCLEDLGPLHSIFLTRHAGSCCALRPYHHHRGGPRARGRHAAGDSGSTRLADAGRSVSERARELRGSRLMQALLTVLAKEFLENLRDRRTLISALLFGPLFGPLLFGAMVSRMLNQSAVESDEPLHLTISGRDHAPGLVRYLESQGVQLTFASLSESTARDAVRSGAAQVVLVLPMEYGPRFTSALPAPVLLVADSADSQK